MVECHIGTVRFRTKKASLTFTRSLLKWLGPSIVRPDHAYYGYLCDLLRVRKPELATRARAFDLHSNVQSPASIEIGVVLDDGRVETFSWVKCASHAPAESPDQKLTHAMRTAIVPSTERYRNSVDATCARCAARNVPLDVDHLYPSFRLLRQEFLTCPLHTPPPVLFEKQALTNRTAFRDEDVAFQKRWIEYHDARCSLQLLCRACHELKTKTKSVTTG